MTQIIDISHHQNPKNMDYDKLAKQVSFVIIRTQYGSKLIDRHYKTHHQEFQKRGIPTAAYAWVRGVSVNDMKKEASDFYERTKYFEPTFWFLDVEEKSMPNIRKGVNAYVQQLRTLGAKRIGIYVGHHLYSFFNLDFSEVDAIWIPHYGKNDGTLNSKPAYPCDLHQYTDKGRLKGYDGPLDFNRIIGKKSLDFFTGQKEAQASVKKVTTSNKGKRVENSYHGPVHFYDGPRWTNPSGIFNPGQGWIITGKYLVDGYPMYQVKNSKGHIYYITAHEKYVTVKNPHKKIYHTIQRGDTVSGLAKKYGSSISAIQKWNKLKNVDKIYVGKKLRVK